MLLALLPFSSSLAGEARYGEKPKHPRDGFLIIIENLEGGKIFAVNRFGDNEVTELGSVLKPVTGVNDHAFTAAMWGKVGAVTATAVNAIHLKVGESSETGFARIFSILPGEFYDFDPSDYKSFYSDPSSLVTDIPAGTSLFGGGFSPKVGNQFFITPSPVQGYERFDYHSRRVPQEISPWMRTEIRYAFLSDYGPKVREWWTDDGRHHHIAIDEAHPQLFSCPEGFVPKRGDIFIIHVPAPPRPSVRWIEFDNRFGGYITMKTAGGEEASVIGQVYQPVFGVGRFEGTLFTGPGRIRANHPGVLDISTSIVGEKGGFQIIPLSHAMSPEMNLARTLTQWMVVGPVDPTLEEGWEGRSPLFSEFFYPSYIPLDDERFAALDSFLSRFQVVVKFMGDEEWRIMPVLSGRVDEALMELERFRIVFPIHS